MLGPARRTVPGMAGRHRKAPAWRRILTSLVRSRDRARTAALHAEVVALRATVATLRAEVETSRARAEAATTGADLRWLTMRLPLVQVALTDPVAALAAADRSPDVSVESVVAVDPVAAVETAPADRIAWSVLANLPERALLDPRLDRHAELRDPATEGLDTAATAAAADRLTA